MEPEDRDEERGSCALCGSAVGSGAIPGYAFGVGNQLCADCATERGGAWDAERDVWSRAPDLRGLADEAYGASPHEERRGRRHG